jgi:hypothetical protein
MLVFLAKICFTLSKNIHSIFGLEGLVNGFNQMAFEMWREYIAVFYQIIPACIYYLPAGASYAVIFILVSRASKLQEVHFAVV